MALGSEETSVSLKCAKVVRISRNLLSSVDSLFGSTNLATLVNLTVIKLHHFTDLFWAG